jgi:uncharacterized membrane protein required for colicin V production
MTPLDWIILAFTLLLAAYGWAQGFLVAGLGLAGFVMGAVLGTRLTTVVMPAAEPSPYAPLFGLAGAVLVGAVLAVGLEGLGLRLRHRLRGPGLGLVDGTLGALLAAAVALSVAWVAGAAALQAPGAPELRRAVQRSALLTRLNALLPPSGPVLGALASLDPFPHIAGPGPDVPPPRAGIARDPDVRAARSSVVRVLGTACGLGIEGSGWAAGPGLVVTNAHVVAGERDTSVQADGQGARLPAVPVGVLGDHDLRPPEPRRRHLVGPVLGIAEDRGRHAAARGALGGQRERPGRQPPDPQHRQVVDRVEDHGHGRQPRPLAVGLDRGVALAGRARGPRPGQRPGGAARRGAVGPGALAGP